MLSLKSLIMRQARPMPTAGYRF